MPLNCVSTTIARPALLVGKLGRIEPGIATSIGASDSRHTAGLTHYGPFAAYVGPNFLPRQGPHEGLRINILLIDLAVCLDSERDRMWFCFPKKVGSFQFHESCRVSSFDPTNNDENEPK